MPKYIPIETKHKDATCSQVMDSPRKITAHITLDNGKPLRNMAARETPILRMPLFHHILLNAVGTKADKKKINNTKDEGNSSGK